MGEGEEVRERERESEGGGEGEGKGGQIQGGRTRGIEERKKNKEGGERASEAQTAHLTVL